MSDANGTRSNLPAPADAPEIYASVVKDSHHY
jgi:hypothetical protein